MKIIIEEQENAREEEKIVIKVNGDGKVSVKADNISGDGAMAMLEAMTFATTKVCEKEYVTNLHGLKMLMRDVMECAHNGMERALEGE